MWLFHALPVKGWETLAILIVVLVMLISNKVRIDLIALFIFLALGVPDIVDEKDLFTGFGSEAVIVIAAMLAIGEALVRSGVTDAIFSRITRFAGKTENRLLPTLMIVGGLLSSFISDLAIVSIFLPVLIGFEKRLHVSAQRLLMPFAIASMLGGMITMVGGATNIVANQMVVQAGLPRLPLFAIAPLGASLLVIGVLAMWLLSRFLLPNRAGQGVKTAVGVHEYLTELQILNTSSWVGKPLKDISFFKESGLNIIRILRADPVRFPRASTVLRTGDVLLVQAHSDDLLKLRSTNDFSVQPEVHKSLESADIAMAGEVIVRQGSEFVGRTLVELRFRERFEVTVVALWRNGQAIRQRIATIPLKTGDMLLLQGPSDKLEEIGDDQGLMLISKKSHVPKVREKGTLAVCIVALIFTLAALQVIPMELAGILGVVLVVIARIISLNQVFRAVEWPILLFVSAMFALGTAMKNTGIIDLVSSALVHVVGPYGPYALLLVCFWMAALVTQVLSNTATTLLLTPVMITAATALHVNPIPFVVTVIVGVTASPLTFVSHKVFLLIMGPGGYRYFDYLRFGLPLTLLFFAVTMCLVPMIWPF
jgi:di/tricarboxylate transporter